MGWPRGRRSATNAQTFRTTLITPKVADSRPPLTRADPMLPLPRSVRRQTKRPRTTTSALRPPRPSVGFCELSRPRSCAHCWPAFSLSMPRHNRRTRLLGPARDGTLSQSPRLAGSPTGAGDDHVPAPNHLLLFLRRQVPRLDFGGAPHRLSGVAVPRTMSRQIPQPLRLLGGAGIESGPVLAAAGGGD